MNNQINKNSNYVVFDLETTGRYSTTCEITEIAALKVVDNQIVESFQSFVKPSHSIPLEVQMLTGISNEMVEDAPLIKNVLYKFLAFIDGQLLIGYNIASFDLHVLNRFAEQFCNIALENYYIDILHLARKCFPDMDSHKLTDVAFKCNIDSGNAHRALADSYMTYNCFNYILKQFPQLRITSKKFKPSQNTKNTKFYSEKTLALKELQNIMLKFVENDSITESGVLYIKQWLDANRHLSGNYPFDKVFSVIEKDLEDNILEQHELEELLLLFKKFTSPAELWTNSSISSFKQKSFCLTGEFTHGEKGEIKKIIETNGGKCVTSVSSKTDYVIVGDKGSDQWACGNYGSKIKKALELQEKGDSIKVCNEDALFSILDKENTEIHPPSHIENTCTRRIEKLLNELIKYYELPTNSLYLDTNISKKGENSGQETSKSICIFEPEYPPRFKAKESLGRNYVVLNLKTTADGLLELLVRNLQYDSIQLPDDAIVKTVKSDKTFIHILFDINSDDLYEYIRSNIIYALANYKSSHSFGCCSKFIQCSDAKRCVHENKLYAKGCKYRIHLEAGRIFYGKNANV